MPKWIGFQLVKQLEPIRLIWYLPQPTTNLPSRLLKPVPFDYLLKPIDKVILLKAMEKVRGKKPVGTPEQMELLFPWWSRGSLSDERMALPTQAGLQFVPLKISLYCISDSNYTRCIFLGGTSHLVSRTLRKLKRCYHCNSFWGSTIPPNQYQKFPSTLGGDGGYICDGWWKKP